MSILEASDFWDENSLLDFSDTQEVDIKKEIYGLSEKSITVRSHAVS